MQEKERKNRITKRRTNKEIDEKEKRTKYKEKRKKYRKKRDKREHNEEETIKKRERANK